MHCAGLEIIQKADANEKCVFRDLVLKAVGRIGLKEQTVTVDSLQIERSSGGDFRDGSITFKIGQEVQEGVSKVKTADAGTDVAAQRVLAPCRATERATGLIDWHAETRQTTCLRKVALFGFLWPQPH